MVARSYSGLEKETVFSYRCGNDVLFGRLYKSLIIPLVQRDIKSSVGKFPGLRHADNSRSSYKQDMR